MRFILGLFLLLLILFQTSLVLFNVSFFPSHQKPIKVGLIYSLTGSHAMLETTVMKANLMAIQEINQHGGLLGQLIEPIVKDSESNWDITQKAINDLILEAKVDVIFGCWNQGDRYTIKKLIEKYNHLLISPFQYGGLITSPNIINIGTSANQQVNPAVYYGLNHFGKRCYLIGSDFIYSHVINTMMRDYVQAVKGEVVGEGYLNLENNQIDLIIQDIIKTQPQVIFCSLEGWDNLQFFKRLREAGVHSDQLPVISFNLNETLIEHMDIQDVVGHYASWNYFESLPTKLNQNFVQSFIDYSGLKAVDCEAEAAYFGVYLWAQAVQEARASTITKVMYALQDLRFKAPEGTVTLNGDGNAAWRFSRIGKIQPNKQFEIVWESNQPIRPIPYEIYRSHLEWNKLIEDIYIHLNQGLSD